MLVDLLTLILIRWHWIARGTVTGGRVAGRGERAQDAGADFDAEPAERAPPPAAVELGVIGQHPASGRKRGQGRAQDVHPPPARCVRVRHKVRLAGR